jgi:hypothetical protein
MIKFLDITLLFAKYSKNEGEKSKRKRKSRNERKEKIVKERVRTEQ